MDSGHQTSTAGTRAAKVQIGNTAREEAAHRFTIQLAMYSAQVLDHFENPRNAGDIASPEGSAELDNPVCGDVVRMTLRIEGERILEARFKARGCVASVACASALTEAVAGKTVAEARTVGREEIYASLGDLPQASAHAAQLALDVLRAALKNYIAGEAGGL